MRLKKFILGLSIMIVTFMLLSIFESSYGTLAGAQDKTVDCEKAIQECQEALKAYTLDDSPVQYAAIQNDLGGAYGALAELKDKAVNCEKAIQAFQDALKVYTLYDLPMYYAVIQFHLGTAYRTLVEVRNSAIDCEKAIPSLSGYPEGLYSKGLLCGLCSDQVLPGEFL